MSSRGRAEGNRTGKGDASEEGTQAICYKCERRTARPLSLMPQKSFGLEYFESSTLKKMTVKRFFLNYSTIYSSL